MTREEAITLIDGLIVCIKEHPIIANWLVEIADRKTENSSEKPNNCETCKFELYWPEMCEGCCEWDSHYEPKTEPQTSGLVWIEDAIKNEPKSYTTWASTDETYKEWIVEYNGNGWNDYWNYTCPSCKKKYEKADNVLQDASFCPNCGARIKGAEDE